MKLTDITAEMARETFSYNKRTGVFTRTFKNGTTRVVGTPHSEGYVQIPFKGTAVLAHRLAWLIVTGSWPKEVIDHRNGKRYDNRFKNLRQATVCTNNQNKTKPCGKVGLLGVTQCGKRFRAQITVNGRARHIGQYDTAEKAHMAYVAAKQTHHPHAHIAR